MEPCLAKSLLAGKTIVEKKKKLACRRDLLSSELGCLLSELRTNKTDERVRLVHYAGNYRAKTIMSRTHLVAAIDTKETTLQNF